MYMLECENRNHKGRTEAVVQSCSVKNALQGLGEYLKESKKGEG